MLLADCSGRRRRRCRLWCRRWEECSPPFGLFFGMAVSKARTVSQMEGCRRKWESMDECLDPSTIAGIRLVLIGNWQNVFTSIQVEGK